MTIGKGIPKVPLMEIYMEGMGYLERAPRGTPFGRGRERDKWIWLPGGAAGEENVRNLRYPRFKPKSLAFRIVIYMKRLGYLEKAGLNL